MNVLIPKGLRDAKIFTGGTIHLTVAAHLCHYISVRGDYKMPFEMDLSNKKEEDNDELFREDSAGTVENNSKKKDQKFSDTQTGDFQELAPDIEIKPEPPAYDDEANEAGAADLVAQLERAQALLDRAKEIEQENPFKDFDKKVEEVTISALTKGDEKEDMLKHYASRLYDKIHKGAKLFLKDYCVLRNKRQSWSNPLREAHLKGVVVQRFVPKIYNLSLVDLVTDESKLIASNCLTAREACIEGAKELGFDNSIHRAKVFALFPQDVLQILTQSSKYMQAERMKTIYEEQQSQIRAVRFVRQNVKDEWLKDLQEKYKNNNVNAFI